MDNKKIGNLIAQLRKQQGLTQQELGDKVGVGFRAVSKWERGLTLPDITIINEVSRILGISSDELLAGELNKEDKKYEKKEIPNNIKITIVIVTAIVLILITAFSYFGNKTYIYSLTSTDEEYYVEGQVTFQGNEMSIMINKLYFNDEQFSSTKIKNYEYEITTGKDFIFGYGYTPTIVGIEKEETIENFAENFQVNCTDQTGIKRTKVIANNITIMLKFVDSNNKEIIKEISIALFPSKKNIE